MFRPIFILLLALFTINHGEALQCYSCEVCCGDCSAYDKVNCKPNETCATFTAVVYVQGQKFDVTSKGCIQKQRSCERIVTDGILNKWNDLSSETKDLVEELKPKFACSFCDTNLCNNETSAIKS